MQLFIVFILGAVVLGAGSMLSPAWRTSQPRIALSATLCLALVVGGAVFYAEAFGWDTLIVDYLLFALMAGVVLGGTLSNAQARAEAKGETLLDEDQGWPGPQDLAFFVVVAIIILIPLLMLPNSLGTHGAQLGYQTLIIRFGESFTSLAPFHPDITVIYSPGFHAFSAYLSQQLGQPIPMIHMSITAVVLYLCVWLAYDLGAEIQDKRLGRSMAIAMLLCGGLFVSYLDGHYTELMGLLFMQAFVMYAIRCLREFSIADMIAGGLMMGAVIYTNLTMSVILLLGFVTLCVLIWLADHLHFSIEVSIKPRLALTFGFPFVAFIGVAPWLLKNLSLMLPPVPSPYTPTLELFAIVTLGQGILIVGLAIWGGVVGLQRKSNDDSRFITLWMLLWLGLVLAFALVGLIGQLIPILGDIINAPNVARHGIILPFTWLGGVALLHLWETQFSVNLRSRLRQQAYIWIVATGLVVVIIGFAFHPLLNILRPVFNLPESTLSDEDIEVMRWINDNTPEDAILYSPEGQVWLPVYTERTALHFQAVKYFEWDVVSTEASNGVIDLMTLENPLFDYIFVSSDGERNLENVEELTLVFEQKSAQLYKVDEAE